MPSYYNLIKVCSIFLLVALPKVSVKAYPGPESTLKQRIAESNYVIVAYVIDTKKDMYGNNLNELLVIQTLKGNIQTKKITVVSWVYACPQAPIYYPGNIVVTYINKFPREPLYFIDWDYEGVTDVSHEGADAYIKRIGEMQQILTISDSTQQANATFEWALRCFEHPETAWEGKLILIPEFSFEAYKGLYGKSFGKTPTQLRRIKEAMYKIRWLPLMGADIIAFAAFNSPPNDPKIIRYLLHQLEIVKPEYVRMRYEFPFHVWELLRATAFFANKEEALEPLIEKIRNAAYKPRRRKRLIRRFSNEILK